MVKSVKQNTQEHILELERSIKELEKDIEVRKVGLQNLKDTLEQEKEYFKTLK
jgi:hypothetical protein